MPQSMESLSLEAVTKELPEIQQLDHEDVKQNEARLTGRLVRSNIGNAKLGGLEKDLDLTQSEYQWSLSIFYFGYVIFDLPSNIIMRRWRPSYWFGILMCAWGAVATAMAACRNFTGLAIARFLLGTFEAGFFPGVIYFMSLWYTRKEYARRVGFFWSFGSLAGAFGGLIAYGISQIPTHTVATWQWLFIIEGAPSVLLSVLAAWYLPNKPEEAKFLTDEERKFAVRRLAEDAGVANDHSWSWKQVASVFSDWKTYVYMAIYILGSIAVQGVTLFLPSIIAGMGEWSLPVAQALTTPPYVLAFVSVIAIGYSSDKFFERALHLVAVNLVSFAGFTILMFVSYDNVVAHYAGACLVTMAVYSNVTVKVAWFNNNFGGLTRRAVASAAIVAVGTIGGAIGGQIYFDPPHYFAGSMIAFACMVAQTILVIGLRITLARENKRRDQLSPEAKEQEIFAYGGVDLAGDRHPDYRYVL
ncbi:major facilitator superfamily domain-containing protein [Radiomyces spectabilis]|uniref:major facilitator superfamily domain-containing protein n=1 Tax=Radiomyces spectabilis TaxID=64574 RepID=UPI0022210000|nr:major facilitator superfamily domain-containing protein [Radiomyces spectabilis]KAI8379531.1 major facilitator superfamily domain-containing protein [Radiomyces spectabilis]